MGKIEDDELVIVDERPTVKTMSLIEYRRKVRNTLLIELANIFDNSISTDWKNWEVSDFLDSYMESE